MKRQIYRLGTIAIELACADPKQQQQIHDLWCKLFQLRPVALQTIAALIRIQFNPLEFNILNCGCNEKRSFPKPFCEKRNSAFHSEHSIAANQGSFDGGLELFRYGQIQIRQLADRFGLLCGDTTLMIDGAQGNGIGMLAADFWSLTLAEQREFFQLAFFLLLRRQGRYLLHANAIIPSTVVANKGTIANGILVVGDCGAGKTTLTVSLLQVGWRCVGDDLVMLEQQTDQVMAHGVRRGFSCTTQTAAAFPILQLPNQELVLLNQQSGGYYTLNKSGLCIWGELEQAQPLHVVSQKLADEYDLALEQAQPHVLKLVSELVREKLVTVVVGD